MAQDIPTNLLAKLEDATEDDCTHILDLEIWNAVSPDAWYWRDEDREIITCDRYGPGAAGNPVCSLDRFSRSVDAALSLMPEGLFWRVTNFDEHAEGAFAEIVNADRPGANRGAAATPALALCIAALRARALPGGGK